MIRCEAEALLSILSFYRNEFHKSIEHKCKIIFGPCCEKTGLRGFRPGPTQTGLCNY